MCLYIGRLEYQLNAHQHKLTWLNEQVETLFRQQAFVPKPIFNIDQLEYQIEERMINPILTGSAQLTITGDQLPDLMYAEIEVRVNHQKQGTIRRPVVRHMQQVTERPNTCRTRSPTRA